MTVDDFIATLEEHGIVAVHDLQEGLAQSPLEATDLAGWLVHAGHLTSFQAELALHGQAAQLNLGNYVLLQRLGRGGMGEVFQARHRRMDRIVALKTLAPELVRHPEALERFHREVKAAARLSHPNIVTAHDADEAEGVHFLVMEFAAGCDLDTVLQRCGPLPLPDLLQIVLQAARGLEYAHSKGVIHRDIKPPNLMLTDEGVVKILDMGLARLSEKGNESFTQTNYIFGSVDYMPPEQAESARRADHRSDIYALGCTLYTLATGQAIYDGESNIQKFLAHREAPIPDLTLGGAAAPPALQALYGSMVAKQPAERLQSMSEVVSALEKLGPSTDLRPLIVRARELAPEPAADPWARTARPGATPAGSNARPRTAPAARQPTVPAGRTPTTPAAGPARSVPAATPKPASGVGASQGAPAVDRWASRAPSAAAQASLLAPGPQRQAPEGTTGLNMPSPATSVPQAEEEWLADAVAAQPARAPKAGGIDQQTLLIGGAGAAGFILVGALLFLVGNQNRGLAERPSEEKSPPPPSTTNAPPSLPPVTTLPPPVKEPPKFEPPPKLEPPPKHPETRQPEVKQPEPAKQSDPVNPPNADPPKADPPKVEPPKLNPLPAPADVLKLLGERDAVGKKGWQTAGKNSPWVVRNGSKTPTPRPPDRDSAGLLLPVTLTDSYDLTLVVEHLGDFGPLLLLVPTGEDAWSMVLMDGEGPPGFGPPGGGPPGGGPFAKRPPFSKGQPPDKAGPGGFALPTANVLLKGETTVVVRVRPNGVTCNGAAVAPLDLSSNPLAPVAFLGRPRMILLASLGNYRLHELKFNPR